MNGWLLLIVAVGFAAYFGGFWLLVRRTPVDDSAGLYDREADGWLLDRACHDLRIDADRVEEIVADDIVRNGRYR